jgi:hypothetical protein
MYIIAALGELGEVRVHCESLLFMKLHSFFGKFVFHDSTRATIADVQHYR